MKFTGGQVVVDRLLKAYGFSTQRELVEKIGVGQGTVSTWIRRDYFPGEAVVQCALDTGVSLEWLATGNGEPLISDVGNNRAATELRIPLYILDDGQLLSAQTISVDRSLLPEGINQPEIVRSRAENCTYIVEKDFAKAVDGAWVIQRADVYDYKKIQRIPGNLWRIDGVDWPQDEIKLIGKVVGFIKYNN